MQQLSPTLVEHNTNFTMTTDSGMEFSRLEEGGLPAEAVHREKRASNDIDLLDRQMQSSKQDQEAFVADG